MKERRSLIIKMPRHFQKLFCKLHLVKRLTGYFLLFLHLMAFTECHQILRLPYLMQHFQQHCDSNPGMNIGEFLKVHYLRPIAGNDDFKQDQQLPFRNTDCRLINTTVYVYAPVAIKIEPILEMTAVFYCYDETKSPQRFSFDIFKPPRNTAFS